MTGKWSSLLKEAASEVGVAVTWDEAERLLLYAGELLRWNRKVNLTAITDEREVVLKHLVDSCSLVPFLPPEGKVVDLGSGGGLPAVVLALLRPGLEIVSVDSVGKKILFQRHIGRLLSLNNLLPLHARVESLALERPEEFDVAVSRAFSSLDQFVNLAKPLVKPGGELIAMKGREGESEADQAEKTLQEEGVLVVGIEKFALPVSGDARSIIIVKKKH